MNRELCIHVDYSSGGDQRLLFDDTNGEPILFYVSDIAGWVLYCELPGSHRVAWFPTGVKKLVEVDKAVETARRMLTA